MTDLYPIILGIYFRVPGGGGCLRSLRTVVKLDENMVGLLVYVNYY